MTKPAHDKIAAGLSDAHAFAQGDETKGRIANAVEALPTLTPAQERALLWLPADGSPRDCVDHGDPRLFSLDRLFALMDLEEAGLVDFAPEYGGTFAITPAGQAARKAIAKEAPDGAQ